jgi:hypothetical protein
MTKGQHMRWGQRAASTRRFKSGWPCWKEAFWGG